MQYFASFEPFEVFEEFNGVRGTYIKSFLISDKINLNDWQATHESNVSNLDTFLGRPGIHYVNPEGKRDHTSATSFEKSLQIQELYRAANIIAVGSDIPTKKNWQVSKMVDESIAEKIKSKEIRWISPSIWPDENSVEQIEGTDGRTIDVVHSYKGLHYAFVDEPAFGDDAEIKSFCDGTTKQCQDELAKFNASIDNVGPITEHKIKLKDKQENSSKSPVNTSHKNNSTSKTQMASEEELQKKLEESEKARKATEEELEELKEKEAKKATEEEEEKKTEGKKATEEEDEEKKELKATVERLEKVPIVDKIVSAQLSAGIIAKEKVSDVTDQLMASSKKELDAVLATSKSFEAKLKSITPEVSSVPYMGSVSDDSEYGSFDASVDEMDYDKLMEVSN